MVICLPYNFIEWEMPWKIFYSSRVAYLFIYSIINTYTRFRIMSHLTHCALKLLSTIKLLFIIGRVQWYEHGYAIIDRFSFFLWVTSSLCSRDAVQPSPSASLDCSSEVQKSRLKSWRQPHKLTYWAIAMFDWYKWMSNGAAYINKKLTINLNK